MKKHPIDEIFRERLENHRIEPSSDAWEKLSGKAEVSKPKGIAYYWYVAATLLIGAVLLYQNGRWAGADLAQRNISVAPNVIEQPVASTEALLAVPEVVAQEPTAEGTLEPEQALAEPVKLQPKSVPSTSKGSFEQKRTLVANTPVTRVSKPAEKKEVAPIERLEPSLPTAVETTPELALTSIPVNLEQKQQENRVILVKVEEPEALGSEKTGKFSKLFQQLKNVKSGDPVDWDQVGINPKALLARVDERLVGSDNNNTTRTRRSKPSESGQ